MWKFWWRVWAISRRLWIVSQRLCIVSQRLCIIAQILCIVSQRLWMLSQWLSMIPQRLSMIFLLGFTFNMYLWLDMFVNFYNLQEFNWMLLPYFLISHLRTQWWILKRKNTHVFSIGLKRFISSKTRASYSIGKRNSDGAKKMLESTVSVIHELCKFKTQM